MNLNEFALNYNGQVVVEFGTPYYDQTRSGSQNISLPITVKEVSENYNLDEYKDPTGWQYVDKIWLPSNSDDQKKYNGKALTLLKVFTAIGVSGEDVELDDVLNKEFDLSVFEGQECYATVRLNNDGDPEIGYRSYKAI